MDIMDYMNETYGLNLRSFEDINTNKNLSLLIQAIRSLVDRVEDGQIAEACYKAAISMVNNVDEPYWKNIPKWKFWSNPKNDDKDRYFKEKSDFTLGHGKQAAVNKLIHQWNKHKVVNVEYFMRSFEVMARDYVRAFEPEALKQIIDCLMPLIELANQRLKERAA